MSDKFFTVVFAGNVEAIPGNPFKIASPFGAVVSISAGEDLLEKNDRLTARVKELEGALSTAAHRLAGAMLSHYAHEAYSIAEPRAELEGKQ